MAKPASRFLVPVMIRPQEHENILAIPAPADGSPRPIGVCLVYGSEEEAEAATKDGRVIQMVIGEDAH